jgi:O-antigen/teichoic acid export membrane protein
MLLRATGIAIGAHFGVTQAILGILIAQTVGTASVAAGALAAFRRFPAAVPAPLGDDRADIKSFMIQSTIASGVTSLRTSLGPLLLGAVTTTTQVGLFRVAQAPQSAFQTLSAPARMVLLTEQTRAWERGNQRAVIRGIRNYSLLGLLISVVLAPPLYIFIPALIRHVNGPEYVGASNAARLFVLTAAVQFVVGWTKSFPVTIGRPELRLRTHTLEAIIVLPLILAFGAIWGAAGAAAAALVGIVIFAVVWIVIVARISPQDGPVPSAMDEEIAAEEADAGALIS